VKYLLDTNAVIAVIRGEPDIVRKRLRRARGRGEAIAVSSVVLFELWYGVARSGRRRENGERLSHLQNCWCNVDTRRVADFV
jgi:tRNA(fMet)-specific endonuclease VapC